MAARAVVTFGSDWFSLALLHGVGSRFSRLTSFSGCIAHQTGRPVQPLFKANLDLVSWVRKTCENTSMKSQPTFTFTETERNISIIIIIIISSVIIVRIRVQESLFAVDSQWS